MTNQKPHENEGAPNFQGAAALATAFAIIFILIGLTAYQDATNKNQTIKTLEKEIENLKTGLFWSQAGAADFLREKLCPHEPWYCAGGQRGYGWPVKGHPTGTQAMAWENPQTLKQHAIACTSIGEGGWNCTEGIYDYTEKKLHQDENR